MALNLNSHSFFVHLARRNYNGAHLQLTRRVQDRVKAKQDLVKSIGIGVSPEAQGLFNSIKKTSVSLPCHIYYSACMQPTI